MIQWLFLHSAEDYMAHMYLDKRMDVAELAWNEWPLYVNLSAGFSLLDPAAAWLGVILKSEQRLPTLLLS